MELNEVKQAMRSKAIVIYDDELYTINACRLVLKNDNWAYLLELKSLEDDFFGVYANMKKVAMR